MATKKTNLRGAPPGGAGDQAIITNAKRRAIKSKRLNAAGASAELRAFYRDLRLEIKHVPIAGLTPYGRELRKHSKRQIEQLAESVAAFGLVQPILIDGHGEIIAGHGLVEAARKAGYSAVPVVRLEHLDEPAKRALRISLNRLAELSGWDDTLLRLHREALLHQGAE
jgi:hypothetical protein